jgi:hypothetical protein
VRQQTTQNAVECFVATLTEEIIMACLSSLRSGSYRIAVSMVAGTLLFAGVTRADDPVALTASNAPAIETGKTENCLTASRIRRTTVVDDRTVLFYVAQNQIYKNVLPYKCSLLRSYDTIIYKPTNNQLCSVDTIAPLDTSTPATVFARCGLGTFEQIDKITADKLISNAKVHPRSST